MQLEPSLRVTVCTCMWVHTLWASNLKLESQQLELFLIHIHSMNSTTQNTFTLQPAKNCKKVAYVLIKFRKCQWKHLFLWHNFFVGCIVKMVWVVRHISKKTEERNSRLREYAGLFFYGMLSCKVFACPQREKQCTPLFQKMYL